MSISKYSKNYHAEVAAIDFGIYNWKRYSTGYLLKQYREVQRYHGSYDFYEPNIKETAPTLKDIDWTMEFIIRLKDELAKRPHISNKRERQRRKQRRFSRKVS